MKKLLLFFTLIIAGFVANAQYTPYNQLNYIKLLKIPPIGLPKDSILVFDSSDGFVKMRPLSALTVINHNAINYATPEQFGAVGNGIADDKTALQNAINTGKMVLLNGNYFTSGTITINNKTTIYGNGKITTVSNLPILDIKASDIVIDGIRFEGNGRGSATNYVTTRPLQIGINLEGVVDATVYKNIRISNVSFFNLGGAGIKTANNKDTLYTGGLLVSNTQADLCYIGYFSAERGEYNSFSNIRAINCEYGAYVNGGNNAFSNIQFESNRTGMYYGTGVNPAKSTVSGGSINHSLDKGLDLNGLAFGQNFYGVQIQVNDIHVANCDAVQFINCDIRANVVSVTTSTNTNFKNCKFVITPTFTGMTSCNFSSTEWLLTPPTGFFDSNEQPLLVNKFTINTGVTQTTDFINQTNGSIDFKNASTVPLPTISGKSTLNSGLFLTSLTSDGNTAGDMRFNTRTSNNTDFTDLTKPAFIFSRFGATLIEVLRNGRTTFTGTVTVPNGVNPTDAVNKGQLDGVATSGSYAPTLTASSNITALTFNSAFYTKLGNVVTARVSVTFSTTSGNTVSSFNFTLPVNKTSSTSISLGNGNSITGASVSNSVDVVSTASVNTATASFISGAGSGANGKATIFIMYDITQ